MNPLRLIAFTRTGLTAIMVSILALAGCSTQTKTINNPPPPPPPTLVSIQVTASNTDLTVDDTEQLSATGTYSDKTTKDITSSVTWGSTPTGIVTIDASGMLTAKSNGSVSVSATLKSVSGSLNLTVAAKLESLAVTPSSMKIAPLTKQQFTATGTFSDGSKQNITGSVSWSSSNTSAATVSDTSPTKGLATAVAAGTTTITATSGSVTNTATLTVSSATPTGLAITPNPATMALDVSQQFTATATFSDATSQDVSNASTWTSSSPQTASVTGTGLVTAKKVTTTPITISATFGVSPNQVSASAPLAIDASNVDSIAISPTGDIAQGTNVQFTATGTFNDGSTHNLTSQVKWASTDPTVLQFKSSTSPQAQGLKTGDVTVSAVLGSVTGTIPFHVSDATIQSVTVTPSGSTIPVGGHETFTATGLFSDDTTQDITTSVNWVSDSAHATVGNSGSTLGIVNGVSAGTANISASFSAAGASVTGSAPLTVSSATLQSLAITPGSALVVPGSTLQFNATGTWTDNSTQVLNSFATWSIADKSGTGVATVSASGVVTGNSAGTATLTAKYLGQTATADVVVEGSKLNSIQVSPKTASVPETIEVPFTAMGNFADGQSLDLTGAVTWTSSAPSVATVSNVPNTAGVATGLTTGGSTVSATFQGQSDSANLTVTNATLVSITVSPANPTINVGNSEQFTAKGKFSDNSVIAITGQVNWTSTNPSVAVIKSSGVANSASAGTTTIKASLNGVTGMTTLTVH